MRRTAAGAASAGSDATHVVVGNDDLSAARSARQATDRGSVSAGISVVVSVCWCSPPPAPGDVPLMYIPFTGRLPAAVASPRLSKPNGTRPPQVRQAERHQPEDQARRGDPLHAVALAGPVPVPRRRPRRDRQQRRRTRHPAPCTHSQERAVRRLRWWRRALGRDRLAHRDLQAQRR
jgi:hypothetical protein